MKGKPNRLSAFPRRTTRPCASRSPEPTGDLGWRLAMPASAPIPPNGADRLGAAQGHTANYGRFLVATGPYMFEGTDQLDFSLPAEDREAVSGYIPGRQIVLVRNPSWNRATDELGPAYADRMRGHPIGGDAADIFDKIEAGLVDYALDAFPPSNVLRSIARTPTSNGTCTCIRRPSRATYR